MKRLLIGAGFLSAVATAAFVPPAAAQPRADAPSPASALAALRVPANAGKLAWLAERYAPDEDAGPRFSRPFEPFVEPPFEGRMAIAERLAVAETYIGIRSDQIDAWRGYTDALLDLLENPPRPQAARTREDAHAAKADAASPLLGERIADVLIEKSASARSLKQASQKLRQSLSPGQLRRLAAMTPPFPPHGADPAERSGRPTSPDLQGEGPGRGELAPPPSGD